MHVDSDPFAGLDDADDGGDAGRGLGTADVQSVFPAEGDGPDTLLAPGVCQSRSLHFPKCAAAGRASGGCSGRPAQGLLQGVNRDPDNLC